jgi:hypothetical protein
MTNDHTRILHDCCVHATLMEAYTEAKLSVLSIPESERLHWQAISRALRAIRAEMRSDIAKIKEA